ncbi:MAG: helix-turn-helix transcriptional regulator [Acidimicrobiia bacterium]|nr:helix-turn-helix transcriptional regulator [Acidimicrobiia bacterium]
MRSTLSSMDVPWLLRRARTNAGLTQRRLAELTGVAQPSIARYETGRTTPSIPTLERLVAACGYRIYARLGANVLDDNDSDLADMSVTLTVGERLQTNSAAVAFSGKVRSGRREG